MAKTKLELTWIGKENQPKLEPRILLEDTSKSYHAAHRVTDSDLFDNRLIYGDNLLALRALEQEFAGQIKCIYIDPPFNTKQAFEHYDDGIEHSLWLSLMRDRIEILHRLLRNDGSLFIHIDDNELGYLIALVDEVFGRKNRISVVTFKQSSASGPKAINPGMVTTSNFVIYYAKDKSAWKPNRVIVPIPRDVRYSTYIDNYEQGHQHWRFIPLREALARTRGITVKNLKKEFGDTLEETMDQFVLANAGKVVQPGRVRPKDISEDAREALQNSINFPGRVFCAPRDEGGDRYYLDGKQILFYSSKVKEIDGEIVAGQPLTTIWDDLLSNNIHKEGGVHFPNGKKPELLLKRILELETKPGEWVLDSFAGSGTTGAVAQKMKRRWIMVELGDHCQTHILPRLRSVIDGNDQSGVTEATLWNGGGGFRYFKLAPSLLKKDSFGNWVISKEYNPAMLAEAICKLEGFKYAPSESEYWQHGYATESDFIYVTTQTVSREQLARISEEIGDDRSLLIMCSAFRARNLDAFPNLTVKKIPKTVLARCEWGKDDYSLEIRNLPATTAEYAEALPPTPKNNGRTARKKKAKQESMTLFE